MDTEQTSGHRKLDGDTVRDAAELDRYSVGRFTYQFGSEKPEKCMSGDTFVAIRRRLERGESVVIRQG